MNGALAQARQEVATATLRADAAECHVQRAAETLEASQAVQSADLRAVIATLKAAERASVVTEAEAPELVLESTPESATKKPATRRQKRTRPDDAAS